MDFVRPGMVQPRVWVESLSGHIYLGSEAFVDRMQVLADRSAMSEISRTQRCLLVRPIEHYRDTLADKKATMTAAYATAILPCSNDVFQRSLCDC